MPDSLHRPRPVSPVVAALALALLLGLQPLTTDLYLPALPALTRELQATLPQAQLTMSVLILAFGLAQLVWGPVADRWGRRPALLLGLGTYLAASLGALLTEHIEWLVLMRALQGVAMAAAVVCARAMIRDLYEPHEGALVMSKGLSGLGLIAISSPVLGGLLTHAFGWRAAFGAVAAGGALTLWLIWRHLPETLQQPNPQALAPATLLANWRRVLAHPQFRAYTLLTSATYGGLFLFLAGSSFVYIGVLGLSPTGYGLAAGLCSVSYLIGTFVCRRWLARVGVAGAVQYAAGFTLAGGAAMALLALAGVQTLWALLLPQMLYAFGHGVHQPCGQAGAVGPFPREAGVASALTGFVMALLAFGVGRWLGGALDGSTRPLAFGIGSFALLTATIAWTLVRRLMVAPAALPTPAQTAGARP
ncbi:MAG: hypothetical protein RJA44_1439 [Pseudomonadota bacterium]